MKIDKDCALCGRPIERQRLDDGKLERKWQARHRKYCSDDCRSKSGGVYSELRAKKLQQEDALPFAHMLRIKW